MAEQAKPRPFILRVETITSRGPTVPYTKSILQLWEQSRAPEFHDIWFMPPDFHQCSDIPIARSMCVKRDLKLPWDAWLWIDDDHEFKPDVILSLVEAMRRGCVDIISPLIGAKSEDFPGRPMIFESYDAALGLWNVMHTGWEKPDLYEVAAVGSGFSMIRREVFEKMPEPWYERIVNKRRPDRMTGNDMYFCLKAKEMGFRVWLDSRVEVGHSNITSYYPRRDYLESGQQRHQLEETKVQQPVAPSKKEDVNTPAFWDEYWTKSGWEWRERRQDVLNEVVSRIPEETRVLHFGCGEGWLAEQIMKRRFGTKVVGLDSSMAAIGLTRKRGVDCHLVSKMNGDWPQDWHQEPFDYLLITDWIERLPDPEAVLRKLCSRLTPDGQILTVVPALGLGPLSVKEHHHIFSKYNLGELLSRLGQALEIDEFTEKITTAGGDLLHEIPRYVSRSATEKVTHAAVSIV